MPTADPIERGGARIHDIAAADTEAFLVEPIEGGHGPAILFLHWFDTEAPDGNRTQFVDEAVTLAREHGVVSLLPQGMFPWDGDPTDAAADAARIRAEVERHRAAVDLLAARPDVDIARIGLVGHDFGGMHGVILAAEEPRIAAIVLIAATPRWGDWFLPFWQIDGDRFEYLRALAPLDPITAISALTPRPVCLQFARNDFFIAAMTGLELQRAADDPKEMHAYDADHAVRDPQAALDRATFLGRALGWSSA
jgi:pimeloyl-ACP methyl ester carboxylesterase